VSQLLIADLDDVTLVRLKEQATRHERTVETEAKTILSKSLMSKDPWAAANALRGRLAASGRTLPDSTELIREDRER
jgi:plasmid stability protein